MRTLLFSRLLVLLGGLAILAAALPDVLGVAAHTPGGAGLGPLGYLAWYVTGAFAFWRRPAHPVARRLLAAGALFMSEGALGYDLFQVAHRAGPLPWLWAANAAQQLLEWEAYVVWMALLAAFPDGADRPYERRLVRTLGGLGVLAPLLLLLARPRVQVAPWFGWAQPPASPLYVPGLAPLGGPADALWAARFALVALGVALLALRARRYRGLPLLQMQWALVASVLYLVVSSVPQTPLGALLGIQPARAGMLPWEIAFTLTPVALAVLLLRYHLLDLELVIRRSLVYGALWLAIALAYAGLAALLGIAASQHVPVDLAIVVTIVVAMVFEPARRRLERLADRWVFGERLGGYALLRRFGATLAQTFDLDQLVPRVATAIRQGLDVAWVCIALYRDDGTLEPIGADGLALDAVATPTATAALIDGDAPIGQIACGAKRVGRFTAADHDLLETLGRQAALAIRNSRLAAELAGRLEEIDRQARELAASRTRLVQAQDAERRRIERNIHDGVQQEIVALLAKVRLARNQLRRDPGVADATLAEVQEETRRTLEDLRELARGIHPAVLSDRGLLDAIEARAARLPLGVTIEADPALRTTRYAAEIEGAAYFLVCEALANVLKHAGARQAVVRVARHDGRLAVEVCDDGRGFVPAALDQGYGDGHGGSGLRGLVDRVAALGGDLRVVSHPGEGTQLVAHLPGRERDDGDDGDDG